MSEKKRVGIAVINSGVTTKTDVYVNPTVRIKKQEDGNYLLRIDGGTCELCFPPEIYDQIRGH